MDVFDTIVGISGFAVGLPAADRIDGTVKAKQASQTQPDPEGLSTKQRSLINIAKNGAYEDLLKSLFDRSRSWVSVECI